MSSAFKFLHASDLHLDRSMQGIAEIPAHLKEPLANAPYAAAERLFDLAINERVDFVLLAGNVVDLDLGGPRCIAFLLSQFERLASRSIKVYWCGGCTDRISHWPKSIALPPNVKVFSSSTIEPTPHLRGDRVLATILGASAENQTRSAADFHVREELPYCIALSNGLVDTSDIESQHIDYWAWGGNQDHSVIQKENTTFVYPGTLQSRQPSECGKHGCVVASVDSEGQLSIEEIHLSVFEWRNAVVAVPEKSTLEEIKEKLAEVALKICSERNHGWQLVHWRITTEGSFEPRLRKREIQKSMIKWLRQEFGDNSNGLWTVKLEIDPPGSLPTEWYEEETLLGDYLRSVSRFQEDPALPLPLDTSGIPIQESSLSSHLTSMPGESRESLLQQATLLGVEVLLADDSNSAKA